MNLGNIIEAAVALLAAVVSAFVIPWLRSRTSAARREELAAWTRIAVAAAEQIYDSSECRAKKEHVLEFLAARGYYLQTDEIEAAIEAAVLELHAQLYGEGGRADENVAERD